MDREIKYAISPDILDDLRGMFYRCLYDEQWTMTFVTKGCTPLTGYEPEELLNNAVIAYGDMVHPDDAQPLFDKCTTNLRNHKACLNEYRIIDRFGEVKTVWEKATGVYDEQGNILYIEGYITDSTDRKDRDEIISELFFYRKAIDMNAICSVADENGYIVYANKKLCEISGYTEKELLGKTHKALAAGYQEGFFDDIWNTMQRGKVWHGEIKNLSKQGNVFWVDTVIIPIPEHTGHSTRYLVLQTPVTDKKIAEEQNLAYMHALEEMLEMLSHDVRQPIVTTLGLIGLSETIEMTKAEEKDLLLKVKECVAQIELHTRKLNEFMQQHKR